MYNITEYITRIGFDPDEVIIFIRDAIHFSRETQEIQNELLTPVQRIELEIRLTRMQTFLEVLECEREKGL